MSEFIPQILLHFAPLSICKVFYQLQVNEERTLTKTVQTDKKACAKR